MDKAKIINILKNSIGHRNGENISARAEIKKPFVVKLEPFVVSLSRV
ncbi:MAG: hypothetical protein WC877_06430 [Dehalococcoidales bacterium]|jgi:hypothetical protein